jgi:uncharacterized cupin superfamily protein
VGIVHWDEVQSYRRAKGEMDATWEPLGGAAGARGVGVNRVSVAPGMLPTPPHSHGASEEIFFVLGGSGLAWQDDAVHEVGPGDCVVHRANQMEHTFRSGPEGLDYLVYGTNHPTEFGWLPRSRAVRLGWPWIEGRTDDPWDAEALVDPLVFGDAAERPPNIVHLDDVPTRGEEDGPTRKALAAAADSRETGLHWLRLPPGRMGAPPHCHSESEEVFVVLEGEGTLELWPSPVAEADGAEREDIPLRAGHVVARPPATRVAHAFRGGASAMTMLVYGTRRPNDICYYPRSRKIAWRGVGLIGRVEALDYWDGEPPD